LLYSPLVRHIEGDLVLPPTRGHLAQPVGKVLELLGEKEWGKLGGLCNSQVYIAGVKVGELGNYVPASCCAPRPPRQTHSARREAWLRNCTYTHTQKETNSRYTPHDTTSVTRQHDHGKQDMITSARTSSWAVYSIAEHGNITVVTITVTITIMLLTGEVIN
jgi:hypothetical protein